MWVVGAPGPGDSSPWMSSGLVASTDSLVAFASGPTTSGLLETAAASSPASTGGALVDHAGDVTGIVLAPVGGDRMTYAVPIATALSIASSLRTHGYAPHGTLGINGVDASDGPTVTQVIADGPAARAGVRVGDVSNRVDGHEVYSMDDVMALVRHDPPGQPVELEVRRGSTPDAAAARRSPASSCGEPAPTRYANRRSPEPGRSREHGPDRAGAPGPHGGRCNDDERRRARARRRRPRAAQRGAVGLPARAPARSRRSASGSASTSPRSGQRIAKVKDAGVLRQLSAIFDTRALGYTSALVAAKVDPDHIDEAAAIVSEHPGVSHNYKRNHAYNLWYTIAVPPGASLDEHIDVLHRTSGALLTRKLPTLKLYKIGVKLDMTGKTAANAKTEVLEHERPERKAEMPAPDLSELELAVIRVVQDDLPNVERPFAAQAAAIGVDEQTIIDTIRSLKERKLMRRFAAVMNHRSAGFKANAMGVWAVPDDRLDEIGPADGHLLGGESLLPPPDVRRLAVQRVHDGARPQRPRLRSDDRGDPRRDRRRRVLPAVVGEGVQEGPAALLRHRVDTTGSASTSRPVPPLSAGVRRLTQ